VGLDAEHRPLVGGNPFASQAFSIRDNAMEAEMGRGLLLWMLGVPIPVIILLWLFFGR
jgi:hypothetical protein